jgi:putative ABC transport system permease protein
MLRNYFKIALRSLSKHKVYTLINLFGLAIGMTCFIIIFLFVKDELSYDNFHKKANYIYRIAGEYDQGGDTRNRSALTTYLMKSWLDTSFPDIENVVRLAIGAVHVKYGDKMFEENRLLFVDENFFEVFSFELIKGDPATALDQPNNMVITEAVGRKYFGRQDPMGKMLNLFGTLVKVTGVMKEMPHNSHFHGDFVISWKTVEPKYSKAVLTEPTALTHYTYVQLSDGTEPGKIEAQLADYLMSKDKEFAKSRKYFLQPLLDIHLRSNLAGEIEANGDILYVYILSAVAFIILFMACINYMNLAVARSANRAKEVGIRKVIGASRKQLVQQFLGESVVTALLALILSIFLVAIFMPVFNELSGKELQLNLLQNLAFMTGLVLLSLIVGGLAGSYPAVFLSALQSVSTLRGRLAKAGSKSLNLRQGLVVVQFTMSVVLLVSTLIIFNQLTFMRNKKLGINSEHVLTIPFQRQKIGAQFEQMRTALLRNPQITDVAATNNWLTSRIGHWRRYKVQGIEDKVRIPTAIVTHDFFRTMQGDIVDGRDFSRDFRTDVDSAYILNESAVKFLGLESPVGTSIVGAIFTGREWSEKDAKIIGVVRDFHTASLHTEIQPVVFSLYSDKTWPLRLMAVRINGNDITKTLAFIKDTWKEFAPARPIQYTFVEEDVNNLYQAEERFLQIFLTFAGLAIVVTCLGLFGLSAYAAAQRTKEIGIRKVLGASIVKIVRLLSVEFLKLVAIANIIAWPIAYLVMHRWLQDFAYRIDIGIWTFLIAAALALAIAMITISFQTIKAALSNPAETLRYE